MNVKLTTEEMQYISLFESITGASARDCVIDDTANRLIFLVNPGQIGLAIGRDGKNIRQLRNLLKKTIEVIEYAPSLNTFIKNCFRFAKIKQIRLEENKDGRKILYVTVAPHQRGLAIGKNKRNITRAKILAKRHFDIDDIILE